MKLKVGILVSPCPSVSALFSMLFSALWLGCGELWMRNYSPRYGWNADIMQRFLRIPVRILPSAFSPHFLRIFFHIRTRRFLRVPVRILPSAFSPHFLRIFSAYFAIQECGDFSAFLSEYSHPHFLRKENAEIWGTGRSWETVFREICSPRLPLIRLAGDNFLRNLLWASLAYLWNAGGNTCYAMASHGRRSLTPPLYHRVGSY